jgi:hypothetical protein
VKDHVGKLGGSTVFFLQLVRLIVVLTLLGLSIFSFLRDEEQDSVQLGGEAGLGALGKHRGGKERKHKHRDGGESLLSEHEWLDLAISLTYVCPQLTFCLVWVII